MKTQKEEIKSIMRFIDNFAGELIIRNNVVYFNGRIVATFENKKAVIYETH